MFSLFNYFIFILNLILIRFVFKHLFIIYWLILFIQFFYWIFFYFHWSLFQKSSNPYISIFSLIFETSNYITFFKKRLKIDSRASLFSSFSAIFTYSGITTILYVDFWWNPENVLKSNISWFFTQQTILTFYKNVLKSILVSRFFS